MGDWVALQDYAQNQGITEQDAWAEVEAGRLMHRELSGASYVYAREDKPATSLAAPSPAVPMYYAERSMATIMRLHDELMTEKERSIDLQRRLMSREQACAEVEYYARLLEAKIEGRFPDVPRPERLAPVRPIRPDLNVASAAPSPAPGPNSSNSAAQVNSSVRAAAGSRPEGWRAW
jgi:hypothetical protein